MWDFSTDPEFQAKLDWIDRFLIEEVEPLDVLYPSVSVVYDTRVPPPPREGGGNPQAAATEGA